MRAQVAYTKAEQALLGYLQKLAHGKMSSLDIVEMRYPQLNLRPRFARESVVTMMNALIKKVEENDESYRIRKSPRAGPTPTLYWVEKVAKAPVRVAKRAPREASRGV
jgi:hypothetical protein